MIDLRGGTWLGQVPLVNRPSMGAGAKEIGDSDFAQVLSAPKAIVDFGSPGCPHCVAFKPIFEAVAAQYPDIVFASVNTDNHQANAATYQVSGLPTVVFLENGKEVNRMVGGGSQQDFINEIGKAFSGAGTGAPGSPITAPSSMGLLGGAALAGVLGVLGYFGYQIVKK